MLYHRQVDGVAQIQHQYVNHIYGTSIVKYILCKNHSFIIVFKICIME